MHLVHEHSHYEVQRKGMRVTISRGDQRRTYWLQLPYTCRIPLIMASTTLHWLTSQPVFLVRISYKVQEHDKDQSGYDPNSYAFHSSGISLAAMLSVLILGACLLPLPVVLGCRKISSNTSVAASCYLALAGAAHRPATKSDAAFWPVKCEEVPGMGNEEVGHCFFTSQEVVERQVDRMYAGVETTGLGHRM